MVAGANWLQPMGPNGPIPRKTAWMVFFDCSCTYRFQGLIFGFHGLIFGFFGFAKGSFRNRGVLNVFWFVVLSQNYGLLVDFVRSKIPQECKKHSTW